MKFLIDKGYEVVAPDLRGYNTSSAPYSISAYALDGPLTDDIAALVKFYGKDGRKPHLVSHDWGVSNYLSFLAFFSL